MTEIKDLLKAEAAERAGLNVKINKDKDDLRITRTTKWQTVRANVGEWTEDAKLIGVTGRVKIALDEDLKKHQYGLMRISIQDKETKNWVSALIHVDVINSLITHVYAPKAKGKFEI